MKTDNEMDMESEQKYIIKKFKPEDAKEISILFYSVYGSAYPYELFYSPERIAEENCIGNIHSVVARNLENRIVAHGAIYRSSPVFPDLYEIGQYSVKEDYRESNVLLMINMFIKNNMIKHISPDAIFGESLCNHLEMQKSASSIGLRDMALEIDHMPFESYQKEQSGQGRITCLFQFCSYKDRAHKVFLPSSYLDEINFLLNDLDIKRDIEISEKETPSNSNSQISVNFFRHTGIGRFNVDFIGSDFEAIIRDLENQGQKYNINVFQYFINVEKPWAGEGIRILRNRGYFFGGYIPRWFNSDGILMQKLKTIPDFSSIRLHSEKAIKLLEFVKTDWERTLR